MKYFLDFGTHKFEGLEEFIPKLQIDKNVKRIHSGGTRRRRRTRRRRTRRMK
jgi:hypothetical protein